MATMNGAGQGGKSFQDRELAAKVRTLGLQQIKQVLEGKKFAEDEAYHKAILLKLAGTLLPRLNEVSGPDGGPLNVNNLASLTDEELENIANGGKKGTGKKGTG